MIMNDCDDCVASDYCLADYYIVLALAGLIIANPVPWRFCWLADCCIVAVGRGGCYGGGGGGRVGGGVAARVRAGNNNMQR